MGRRRRRRIGEPGDSKWEEKGKARPAAPLFITGTGLSNGVPPFMRPGRRGLDVDVDKIEEGVPDAVVEETTEVVGDPVEDSVVELVVDCVVDDEAVVDEVGGKVEDDDVELVVN